ncbi:MAG TPA: hypothetical protein ENF57_01215 [Candidatus Korarchaeota archaeon]|nr:hypothetical protein [Candidatus Korarchaeota archaeon]
MAERYLILDTSFLMALGDLRFLSLEDLLRLYPKASFVTTKSVVKELENLIGSRRRVQARISLEILSKYGVRVFEDYDGEADDDVLELAMKLKNAAVATFDLELKERLLRMGIPVIYLRAGKKLVLDDPLKLSKGG